MHTDHLRSRIIHLTAATIYVPQVQVLRPYQSINHLFLYHHESRCLGQPHRTNLDLLHGVHGHEADVIRGTGVGTADIRLPGGANVVLVLC